MKSFEGQPQREEPVETAKRAIMPAEEYAELEHERPYVYEVEAGDKKVTYFAPGHSWDPDNPAWEDLKNKFKNANPDSVLVEGIPSLSEKKQHYIEALKTHSEEEIISKMGEPGLSIKLAVENNVDFDCPEPSWSEEIKHLERQGFSREEIFGYYVFRQSVQWQKSESKEDFKDYLQQYTDGLKQNTDWDDFDYSYKHAEELSRKWWSRELADDKRFYSDKVDPIPWEGSEIERSRTNLVATASTRFRDERAIEMVDEKLKGHDRIFIVYGASHAVMQEPAIRRLLEDKQ